MASKPENPFVGPAPIPPGAKIHGRDEDLRELLWLLTAERIVWLHSPSGAGKTSLLQAGLIPLLEKKKFEVLPVVRVGQSSATGIGNRYEASVLNCLGTDEAGSLAAFVKDKKRAVLIFDQFEELLTLDRADDEGRRAFFSALGEMLQQPRIWALFSVREDYLPAFDSYSSRLPTLMNHRYRLDLLRSDDARLAMEQLAVEGNRRFDPDASQLLAAELSKGLDGKAGPFVEPVLLQVVCRSLWSRLREEDRVILPVHVPQGEDLTKELANFVSSCVRQAVGGKKELERDVRRWIGEKLILGGVRNQLLDARKDGAGLDLETVQRLEKSHLIRRDDRSGRWWYELAHDRLVAPAIADNARWEEENLRPPQRQAELWRLKGRPRSLLLSGREIAEAEQRLAKDGFEREFLDESKAAEGARATRRLMKALALVTAIVAVFAGYSLLRWQASRVKELTSLARKKAAADESCAALSLANQSIRASKWLDELERRQQIEELNQVLEETRPAIETDGAQFIAFSGDCGVIAIGSMANRSITLYAWPHKQGEGFLHRWVAPEDVCGKVTAVALNADGSRIGIGFSEAKPIDLAVLKDKQEEQSLPCTPGPAIEALAFSATGQLVSASLAGEPPAKSLAFDADGTTLAMGGNDGKVRITNLAQALESGDTKSLNSLAWAGGRLVAAAADRVVVWKANEQWKREPIDAGVTSVQAIALTSDASRLAIAGTQKSNQKIEIWSLGERSTLELTLIVSMPITGLHFAGTALLVNASADGMVKVHALDEDGLLGQLKIAGEGCSKQDGN